MEGPQLRAMKDYLSVIRKIGIRIIMLYNTNHIVPAIIGSHNKLNTGPTRVGFRVSRP